MTSRSPAVAFVLVTLALDAIGLGIVIPVQPALVEQLSQLGPAAAAFWQGAALATFAGAQFLMGPILGGLSDRYGRRPVILISVAGLGASYLLLAWAPTLAWVFLARGIAGGTAANVSAVNAYIADVTPPEARAKRFGLVGAVFSGAFILGPAFGGVLGQYGLRLPFLVASCFSFVSLLYGVFVLPESLPPERRRAFDWRRANVIGSARALSTTGNRRRLAGAWACTWFAFGALQATFVLYTTERLGWGTGENGIALGLTGLAQMLVQLLLVRRVVGRLGEVRTVVFANLCSIAAYVVLGLADQPILIYGGIVILAVGSMAGPGVQAMVSMAAGPDAQGELQGALSSVQGLTAIGAPLVGAFLFAHYAAVLPGAAFFAAAIAYAFSALLIAGITSDRAAAATMPAS